MQLIELSQKYNEYLSKIIKGDIWFNDKNISDDDKKQQEPRYKQLMDDYIVLAEELQEIGIAFSDKSIDGFCIIDIPEKFKREKIELWLEKYSEFKNKKL
jgi:hypothetical protein